MRNGRRPTWLIAATALGAFTTAWAGPPFLTDDPEPVPYKHWELYLAGQYFRERDGESAAAPQLEFNYGALPDLQLHIIAPMAYDRPKGEESHYGYGDTELGIKYRFIHETEHVPQVATFPLLLVPTGNEDLGLGSGDVQIFLPLWLQKSWGKWTTYGGGGWWYNPGDEHRNFWRFGWEVQREVMEGVIVGAEIFHHTPEERGGKGSTGFNIGSIIDLSKHNHLLFSAGRDIDGPSLFQCYVGFQLTY